MNTNSKSKEEIQQAFENIFSYEDREDEIKHRSKMLMFCFLNEVERIAEERKLKKKDLAKIIGTSPSYITQLFRGDKLINLETLAKLERGLGIEYEIAVKTKKQTKDKALQQNEVVPKTSSTKKKHKKLNATSS